MGLEGLGLGRHPADGMGSKRGRRAFIECGMDACGRPGKRHRLGSKGQEEKCPQCQEQDREQPGVPQIEFSSTREFLIASWHEPPMEARRV
jgi:hypothetical protein